MKNTKFTKFHLELGAKMAPFAGYNMPIQYESIQAEHMCVREQVGVFDVSHMGEFWVKGPNAFAFIQYITTNDLTELNNGKVQYSCFPNGQGGIVDDLLVYKIDDITYLLVVNAANIDKDWDWCCKHAPKFNLEIGKDLYNASDEISQLAIQGPKAMEVMQLLTLTPIMDMANYTFQKLDFAGIKNVIFATTGYTGAGGCEIYCANEDAETLWHAIFEKGKSFGIKPIGLGARDTLRLEMGYCLYGHDINDTTSPIEAGLGWITKFNETKNFIDKDILLNQKQNGVSKKLVGFKMNDKGIPRQHYEITTETGEVIGEVTSGTISPVLKVGIGMGYVDIAYAKPGTSLSIKIREKLHAATVTKFPFINK